MLPICLGETPHQLFPLGQVPLYSHVKEVVDPETGARTALEICYMKFLAFNGSYKLWGRIYLGEIGAHDADWEHVRPSFNNLLCCLYSSNNCEVVPLRA